MVKKLLYIGFLLMLIMGDCKSKRERAAEEILDKGNFNSTNLNAGTKNYSIYLPKGWTTAQKNYKGVDIYYLLAPQTVADPNTSINVISEYMQNYTLDVFMVKTIQSLKNAIPSAAILAQGNITANGIKGSWYSYTMQPQGLKASLVSYVFPKNGVAYAITAGTQPNDAARYRHTFDSVARSLKFNE